jgi:rubrerythrin
MTGSTRYTALNTHLGPLLNAYRSAELHGALLMGKLARRVDDPEIKQFLTHHFADEARHAWMWTEVLQQIGEPLREVPDAYQQAYSRAAGLPSDLIDLLATTLVLERRSLATYEEHLTVPGMPAPVCVALERIIVEERRHLAWLEERLDAMRQKGDAARVDAALARFVAIDERAFAAASAPFLQPEHTP